MVALPCAGGKCTVKASLGGGIFGIDVGPCSIALQDLRVLDDTGAAFAERGFKVL